MCSVNPSPDEENFLVEILVESDAEDQLREVFDSSRDEIHPFVWGAMESLEGLLRGLGPREKGKPAFAGCKRKRFRVARRASLHPTALSADQLSARGARRFVPFTEERFPLVRKLTIIDPLRPLDLSREESRGFFDQIEELRYENSIHTVRFPDVLPFTMKSCRIFSFCDDRAHPPSRKNWPSC